MGSPSACDECGKKFKVFGLKKKCKHCMDVVCKSCLAAHLELKHTHLNRPPRGLRRRQSLEIFDAAGHDAEQELQFLSPIGSPDLELEYADVLDGVDGVEAVSDEDDDGDLFDCDDAEDDDLLMTTLSRQSSIEEEEIQYTEMQKIQGAVATWALKEKQAKMELRRRKKKDGYCSMSPVFPEVCEYENCSVFVMSYAVLATVAVWALFGLLMALYLRARSLPVGLSYVL
ncbi:hypothetical protein PHYPSEUDO_008568 [Phytophthora pseudosyringae]|uniref:FYVE zinc finger domain-containing protein n=1 Tax=Phytophthora pseudosyringae TaxID=221518 RepID=A0A8T1VH49_9STRA|nr:hypothetical protein PHYPSEUDO_008568 [Phytophthora pseudosyringae]